MLKRYNKRVGMLKRYGYTGMGNIGSMGNMGSVRGDKKSGEKWGVCV